MTARTIYFSLNFITYNNDIMTDWPGEIYVSLSPLKTYLDRRSGYLSYTIERLSMDDSQITLPVGEIYSDNKIVTVNVFGSLRFRESAASYQTSLTADHISNITGTIKGILLELVIDDAYKIPYGSFGIRVSDDALNNHAYSFYTYTNANVTSLKWRKFSYDPSPEESDAYKKLEKKKNDQIENISTKLRIEKEVHAELLREYLDLKEKYECATKIETRQGSLPGREL